MPIPFETFYVGRYGSRVQKGFVESQKLIEFNSAFRSEKGDLMHMSHESIFWLVTLTF